MSGDGGPSDFWQYFSWLLKTPRKHLFLQLITSAPESLRQSLKDLFDAFEPEWTHTILRAYVAGGPCNKQGLAIRLFPNHKNPRDSFRGKPAKAFEHLVNRGYLVRIPVKGPGKVYAIADSYRAACESILSSARV